LCGIAAVAIAPAAAVVQIFVADSSSQITAQEFLEPIKYLASDQLKGRGDGTRELDKAAKYIANHFRKFGLKPGGDKGTYLQHFTLVVGAKLGRNNSLHYQQATKAKSCRFSNIHPLSFSKLVD
jgi:hypothetical protein